jgi:hypothetical protein
VILLALDPFAIAVDVISILVLIFALVVGWKAVRSFRQSRQAVTESASLLGVIVNSIGSRIESSESIVRNLALGLESMTKRGAELESKQSSLQTGYMQVLRYLQDALLNDKRLILELEQLKSKLTSIEQRPVGPHLAPSPALADASLSSGDLLSSLTPTERQTVEILIHEGAKGAPELGRRMRKSREHMARLMKKLYMEGYVDRESNYAPFRYKLSEKVRQILESQNKTLTAAPSEKA